MLIYCMLLAGLLQDTLHTPRRRLDYCTMVATAGIAVACLLTSQDSRHSSLYYPQQRPKQS
jgi:hypothetical protein